MIPGAFISRPVLNRHGIFYWLLRTLVKVRYTFFLVALLMGIQRGFSLAVLVWLVVVFVAVLTHELGHAVAAQYYGQRPQIELHALVGGSWSWPGVISSGLPWPGESSTCSRSCPWTVGKP